MHPWFFGCCVWRWIQLDECDTSEVEEEVPVGHQWKQRHGVLQSLAITQQHLLLNHQSTREEERFVTEAWSKQKATMWELCWERSQLQKKNSNHSRMVFECEGESIWKLSGRSSDNYEARCGSISSHLCYFTRQIWCLEVRRTCTQMKQKLWVQVTGRGTGNKMHQNDFLPCLEEDHWLLLLMGSRF